MSPVTTTLPSDTAASSPRDPSSRYQAQVLSYVGVPNVEAALAHLGGTRMMGPDRPPEVASWSAISPIPKAT
jgi:hypothetical protein